MFKPPSKTNWVYTHRFDQCYAEAYQEGYNAAKAGEPRNTNPHKESGHERDTTYEDELHFWWANGWNDCEDGPPVKVVDETDYYGELWSAIHEQERLLQAVRLVEGLKAFPSTERHRQGECLQLLRKLLDLNNMEVCRRKMLYDQSVKGT